MNEKRQKAQAGPLGLRSPDLFTFRWDVEEEYRWLTAKRSLDRKTVEKGVERFLTFPGTLETQPTGIQAVATTRYDADVSDSSTRRYEPLAEHSGLFRTFAEIEPTEPGILEFASRYGHLGIDSWLDLPSQTRPRDWIRGESLSEWQREIEAMRKAVQVVNLIRGKDASALKDRIQGPYGEVFGAGDSAVRIEVIRAFDNEILAKEVDSQELVDLLHNADAMTSARAYVCQLVNPRLEHHTTSRLLFESEHKRVGLHVNPRNLLGALWTQLALDVDSARIYRRCDQCQQWFELLPRIRRKNTTYCSRSCRSAAYRDRQDEARRLRSKGETFAQIAKKLDSDQETVQGWVEGTKRPDRKSGKRR